MLLGFFYSVNSIMKIIAFLMFFWLPVFPVFSQSFDEKDAGDKLARCSYKAHFLSRASSDEVEKRDLRQMRAVFRTYAFAAIGKEATEKAEEDEEMKFAFGVPKEKGAMVSYLSLYRGQSVRSLDGCEKIISGSTGRELGRRVKDGLHK